MLNVKSMNNYYGTATSPVPRAQRRPPRPPARRCATGTMVSDVRPGGAFGKKLAAKVRGEPLSAEREALARSCFSSLDKDGSGLLSKGEFLVIMAQLSPGIDEAGIDRVFKKAKIAGDEMDADAFCRWASKVLGKADDDSFKSAMELLAKPLETALHDAMQEAATPH